MAEMGDPWAAVCTEFLQRLAALPSPDSPDEPTLDKNDRYMPSPREVELTTRLLVEDYVVALGPPELRRQMCLTVIREKMSSLAVIVGQRIAEDDYFLDYLRILLAADIRIVPSAPSWPRGANKCVCLVEPDMLWPLLANSVVSNAEVNVLGLRDFEPYLDLGHAYRKMGPCFQKVSEQNKNSSASTWLLALADEMHV
ncbi:hypothetical protein HPB49_014667 [Dermacentor silvarum]|uniref:Uncharacterized protein n=1 Tax=Dermacentor silvarum TaxID=543639 RepID=A0ACB8DDP6_DERSI|nr:hypothetical protein HPB49_014667 [Dermacentor silvarum]